jgi:molybdopterin molybdotransferase
MISVQEAQRLVCQQAARRAAGAVPLGEALGLVLAEDVASDLDSPPFDKALMDGYALRAADVAGAGGAVLAVVEEIPAGKTPEHGLGPGEAARIMTGAMLPAGADAVVMIEHTSPEAGQGVRICETGVRPGQNVLRRGREMRRGEVVLAAGTLLRPQELGLLAALGRTRPRVYPRPTLAILSTGDELVEPDATPGPGQIRNSNATQLAAQAARAGAAARTLGIARDRLDSLRALIATGLQADVLVLSGGVSAGKLDLVPGVLQELGVRPVFHKVAMKPGKPLFFGVRDATLVFGLPGNPVSALIGFELFVRPALRLLLGREDAGLGLLPARLGADHRHKSDRPTYHPARLELAAEGWRATPVDWFGSADLRAIAGANAFVLFTEGERDYRQGEAVSVLAPELVG